MNILLIQTILAARSGEGDDTFWIQMLVLVIVVAFISTFWLSRAKAKPKRDGSAHKSKEHHEQPVQKPARFAGLSRFGARLIAEAAAARPADKSFKNLIAKKDKDLQSGMEILELDFLLKVVESANGDNDEKDIAIRKLNFKELSRRGELGQIDSKALKNYALNKGNIYGKDIQCEAIQALAQRTAKIKPAN
jgi:hypothetical protein